MVHSGSIVSEKRFRIDELTLGATFFSKIAGISSSQKILWLCLSFPRACFFEHSIPKKCYTRRTLRDDWDIFLLGKRELRFWYCCYIRYISWTVAVCSGCKLLRLQKNWGYSWVGSLKCVRWTWLPGTINVCFLWNL